MSPRFLMLAALMAASGAAAADAQPRTQPTARARAQAAQPPSAPSPPQAPVQARPGGPELQNPRSDQTVDVAKGTRLVLSHQAGEVTVRAWDRDAVRVQASHGSRESLDLQTADNTLRVRVRTTARGPAGLVDFTITVPRWMPVNLSGTYLAANIEGTSAEVNVETVGGDVTLKGGSGAVTLRSIEGEIRVEDASGKVQATTVNDSITVTGVSGDVVAETVNGDVAVTNSKASSLEVSTVNGDVRFEGPTADRGTYRITTHNGDIRVSLGAQANATVFVRTFGGDFTSDFPVTLPDGMSNRDGNKRFNFTLGAGSARVELQSFQGDIHVAKGPLRSREQERGKKRGAVGLEQLGREVQREVEQEFEREFGPNWEREVGRLREWAGSHVGPGTLVGLDAPPTPPTPPPPPAPPRAPRVPRPPQR